MTNRKSNNAPGMIPMPPAAGYPKLKTSPATEEEAQSVIQRIADDQSLFTVGSVIGDLIDEIERRPDLAQKLLAAMAKGLESHPVLGTMARLLNQSHENDQSTGENL